MNRLFVVVLCVAALGEPAGTPLPASRTERARAVQFAVDFYGSYLPRQNPGLPSRSELEVLRHSITPRLHYLFVRALEYRAGLASTPGWKSSDKPPCVEHPDYFVGGLDEWPDNVKWNGPVENRPHFRPLSVTLRRDGWRVRVRFWYHTTPRVKWETTLELRKIGTRFVIDEVIDPASPHDLSSILEGCSKGQGW